MVFGGASILDAGASREMTVGMPDWMRGRWPGLPDVTVRAEAGAAGLTNMGGFRMPGRGPGDREPDFEGRPSRNVTAWHYGAGLAYDLAGGDVRPVIVFGAGGVSYSGARESETDFALRFGAGLRVYFGRVGGRVEVVDHLVVDHFLSGEAEHDIHATAGFLVRF